MSLKMKLVDAFWNIPFIKKWNEKRYITRTQLKFDVDDELYMWRKFGKIARFDYLLEIEKYAKQDNNEEYVKYVVSILHKCLNGHVDDSIVDDIEQFVIECCGQPDKVEFEKSYSDVLEIVSSIEATAIEIGDWNILEFLFLYFRTLRLAYMCRCKKNQLLIQKNDRKGAGYARWYALLESGMVKQASEEVEAMRSCRLEKKAENIEFVAYLTDILSAKDSVEAKRAFEYVCEDDEVTKSFREYVDGKTIIIVGPAPGDRMCDVNEDIVIRMNEEKNIDISTARCPRYTDISYYRGETSERISKNPAIVKHIKYKVIRNGNTWNSSMIPDARAIMNYDYMFPSGSANNIQNIVLDLLRFSPKSIRITGSNLFLSNIVHEKSYATEDDKGYMSAIHNHVEQFVFMKLLYNVHCIEPDDVLRSVLEMEPLEYVEKLENSNYLGRYI